MENRIAAIDAMVDNATCVVSASDGAILEIVAKAVQSGASATFYVSRSQAKAINAWYWTPERRKQLGVEDVSPEELHKIEEELGLKDVIAFSNRIPCEKCGHVYGAFEFLQQGIREHGRAGLEAVLGMENTSLIRVNPSEVPVCPNCGENVTDSGGASGERIIGGTPDGPPPGAHWYGGTSAYAGCCRAA
ncbi:hypothetical protein [Streptomyces sp. GS7]|uniref:hypothetical protein n=1 Tax=Streptomyces sp. GS7 TaxID=2692234 RepID=UPI0013182EA7|nr:hypothetical protein [Streptomyces sp. GS7]QHC25958.1 hypothetical protein GR130_35810 [Streptomyces sp. GS7]